MKKEIKKLLGLSSHKIQIPGVYIFTHKLTGSKYVGSSSQLLKRLALFIKEKDKISGLFIPLLYKEGFYNFKLEIIPYSKEMKFQRKSFSFIAIYLLNSAFNLNRVKVVNNPRGSNVKGLYMYNRDKTILYYYSREQKNFIDNFNIHFETMQKHLKMGTYYLGRYSFTRCLIYTAKFEICLF